MFRVFLLGHGPSREGGITLDEGTGMGWLMPRVRPADLPKRKKEGSVL